MKSLTYQYRYQREGAIATLKNDIREVLLNLKGQKKLKDFSFMNEDFSAKAGIVNVCLTLNTITAEEICLHFSLMRRESEEYFLMTEDKSRFLSIQINKSKVTLSKFREELNRLLGSRFKGYFLEDLVFKKISEYLDNYPNGILTGIRKTSSQENRQGKDFEIFAYYEDVSFSFFIDIKSKNSFYTPKNLDRNEIRIIRTDELALNKDPRLFCKRLETISKEIYHHRK